MRNQRKFDARKWNAQIMKNVTKWSQNGSRNREKGMPTIKPKFDIAKGKVFGGPAECAGVPGGN